MTILFCGGEHEDCTITGVVTLDVGGVYYRTAYARGGLHMLGANGAGAKASFAASSSFWMSFRLYTILTNAVTYPLVVLSSGANARLQFRWTAGFVWQLEKFDGTTTTVLATATGMTPTGNSGAPAKMDVQVVYGVSGSVKVYGDQVLYLSYTGDTTAGGSTTLDSVTFQNPSSGSTTGTRHVYSEIIVCTQDSRTLHLATLAPNAAGTTNTFTSGAYTDIDETTASDTDVAISGTTGQIIQVNCTGMPTGWSNLSVIAVKNIASAAKGATGPSKLAVGVRTGGTDYYETATALDGGYSVFPQKIWELNPVTGVAWTTTEIDALQLAYKSET
jgi:hypothetical protein